MKIQPLSEKTYNDACTLVVNLFNCESKEKDYPPRWFKISLHPEKHKELFKKQGLKELKYYVAIDNKTNKVIGTTGYYTIKEDEKEAYWLGWWCVDPKYRQKGIGAKLLNFIITKAKKANKKYLRLYTSNEANEKIAQIVYEKKGFKISKKKQYKGESWITIYRELKIK